MKRQKPDIMLVLTIVIGLSVIVTGFAQEFKKNNKSVIVSIFQQ